jgi:hypothetical protein
LNVHTVDGHQGGRNDLSPLVYDPRSESVYIGHSLGRGAHWRVYNGMQRLGALTPAVATHAHGYRRPDGAFEWYEWFPVPGREEERELRAAIEGGPGGRAGARANVRRRLRPLRAHARRAAGLGSGLGRAVRPPRPPGGTHAVRVQRTALSELLSPEGLASRCRWVLDDTGFSVDETIDNDWWYCKSDWLEHLFRELAPASGFVLFSGNSDRPIGRALARFVRRRNLVAWFANNVSVDRPKLFSLPLGPGHQGEALRAASGAPKTRLFEVSFDIKTNPRERLRCLAYSGLELDPPADAADYLQRLASSYFCVAPRGNGIDTHRMWEALYLGTIPIVTRSVLTEQHPELPLVVLDDWSEFGSVAFSQRLYERTCGDWQPAELSLDRYLARVAAKIEQLRPAAASA